MPSRFPHRRPKPLSLLQVTAGALLAVLVPIAGLEGQAPTPLSPGTLSLSFGIDGSGSGEAGVWMFLSDRTNLGLLGSLDWVSEDRGGDRPDQSRFTLGVGPRVKWYLPGPPRVAPFWFGGLNFVHTRASVEDEPDRTSRGAGVEGGFGVDWFPVDQMSVGGWTGLRFSSDRAPNDDVISRIRTFTTGLRVHVYF